MSNGSEGSRLGSPPNFDIDIDDEDDAMGAIPTTPPYYEHFELFSDLDIPAPRRFEIDPLSPFGSLPRSIHMAANKSNLDDDVSIKSEPDEEKIKEEENRLRDEVCASINKIVQPDFLPSKTKLKLQVNRVTLTASWKWRDSKDDDACGICRGAFEACCTNCKMPGDECPLALGDCKHPFHLHCINKWADSQPKPSCPLCRTEWKSAAAPTNRGYARMPSTPPIPTST